MARVRAAIALHCCELLWIGSYMKFLCLDREIIRCLSRAAPMPDVKVAAMLNVPDFTTLHRLSRLIDDGVGSCVTLTDPWKVGYRLSVMTSLEVELGVIQRLLHSVHEFLGIYFVMVTTGHFTIIAIAFSTELCVTLVGDVVCALGGLDELEGVAVVLPLMTGPRIR